MSDLYEFCKVEEFIFCHNVLTKIQEFCEKEIKKKEGLLFNSTTRKCILLFEKCLPRGRFLIHKCAELVDNVKSVSVGKEPDRRVAVYVFNYKNSFIFDCTRKKSMTSKDTRIDKKRPDKEIFIPRYRRTCDDLATKVSSTQSDNYNYKKDSIIKKQDQVKEHRGKNKNNKKLENGVPINNKNSSVNEIKSKSSNFKNDGDCDQNDGGCDQNDGVCDHINNMPNECDNACNEWTGSYQLQSQLENELITSLPIDSSSSTNSNKILLIHPEKTIPSMLCIQNVAFKDNTIVAFENFEVDTVSTVHTHIVTTEIIQELLLDILSKIEILLAPHSFNVAIPVCSENFENQTLSSCDNKIESHLQVPNNNNLLTGSEVENSSSSSISANCYATFIDQIVNVSEELILDSCQKDGSLRMDSQNYHSHVSEKGNSQKHPPHNSQKDDFQEDSSQKSEHLESSKSSSKLCKKEKKLKRNKKKKKICSSIVEKDDNHHIEVTKTIEDQVSDCGNDWDLNWTDDGTCLNNAILEFSSLTDIKDPIVEEAQIIDYLSFSTKDIVLDEGEFGHIVELFDFSPVLKSQDIFNALKCAGVSDYNITWVDDTHALAVFSSQKAAHEAIKSYSPMLQMRQVINGTRQSKIKAREFKDVLLPYKKRPPTTGSVARNLISGALGIKTNLTNEQKIKDRNVLKEAREQKRLKTKQMQDVWEGN
ncbi:uncharacterized protein LOC101236319 isoform X1 [Hydra vulgaris]|uniref:Uncharacterized protein LOC101236319 isoform X1 n=1 Tax=Hydra vulgaris TaxID=6087 RepID=A0ABM4BHS8_HYDVU